MTVLSALILSACASVTPRDLPPAETAPKPVSVRHFGSTEFHNGTRFRLFTFDPRVPRSLDERIRLAKAEVARDPACRWGNAPRDVIEAATNKQGAGFRDTLLAAPVECST